ncbi:Vacuolar protein sorting-associated protein 55, partial [Penicillium argentinense]
ANVTHSSHTSEFPLPSIPINGDVIPRLLLNLSLGRLRCNSITTLISSRRPDTFGDSAIMAAGLKTIIALSFVLAIGFLLVILSSALWHKYWPLLVVAIYIIAPLPNWICGRCANPDDFMDSSSNSAMDFGRFMTGFLVLTGIALPVVLAHSGAIEIPAMIMSIFGGLLIYGTIISFSMFFQEQEEF